MQNLANASRPKQVENFVGQEHIMGKEAPFYKLLIQNKLPHSFFFGPAGTGKTSLARIVASHMQSTFFEFNATSLKIDELRKVLLAHQNSLIKPVIFIDELHRLAKNQQEVILPFMERFDALFIGASTENPFFTLTSAIRSRGMLFVFKPLRESDLEKLADNAIRDHGLTLEDDALSYLIVSSGGDARAMLNLLECAAKKKKKIDLELLKSLRPTSLNDGTSSSETHYNLASAMIKSIRGSDTDAAVYYLARLIEGGEDPKFIARRLLILASEDIGNANPNAFNLAANAFYAVSQIGYPESRIILSQLVIYLAASPKSNTALLAVDKALDAIRKGEILDVPDHLKDAHFHGAGELGRGIGYRYPHDFGGWVAQEYLKKPLKFVELKEIAYEKRLREWLQAIKG
jgi:putative ATPase